MNFGRFAFDELQLHRIQIAIIPRNLASRRVVEKLGFREEGVRRRQLHIDGAWRDHICYALTVEDVPRGLLVQWRRTRDASTTRRSEPSPG